ncbi:MAG: AMP-binding protein [Syntrophomonadaceae bacterium]|nr:AMP-binding protein [Syntrophomonadaceae bacterium]
MMRFKAMDPIWEKTWPENWPRNGVIDGKDPLFQNLYDNATRFRDKPALIYYGGIITWWELRDMVLRAASGLQKLGVTKGDRVYLGLQNCPQFYIAFFAAHSLGAIVVPGSPMFKAGELTYALNDSGAKVIITEEDIFPIYQIIRNDLKSVESVVVTSLGEYLPEEPYPAFPLAVSSTIEPSSDYMTWPELMNNSPIKKFADVTLSDIALLQYTSGTTGYPKGAMLTHGNIKHRGVNDSWMHDDAHDYIHLACMPLFHVTGMGNHLLCPAYCGGTVVVMVRFEPEAVLQAIERYRVTYLCSITTMDIALITHPKFNDYDISSIRGMTMGGAPLPPNIQQKYEDIGLRLAEGYGMSETMSTMTWNPFDRIKQGTVGIPIAHVEVRIADKDNIEKNVPLGEQGELWVRGPSVAAGYWNKPEETAETFVEGWIRTGDIATMDEDGYVTLNGRLRELIKASGYSVFPAEVETYLYQHPAILECCVIGVFHEYRGEDVKAFVVLEPEWVGKITEEELVAWAREQMSVYKYPRTIEFRDELPKSGTGKIMRRILKAEEDA